MSPFDLPERKEIALESHWKKGCVPQRVAGTPWTNPISVDLQWRQLGGTGSRLGIGELWWCLGAAANGPCDLRPCPVTVKAHHSRGSRHYCSHYTDKETEAQKVNGAAHAVGFEPGADSSLHSISSVQQIPFSIRVPGSPAAE